MKLVDEVVEAHGGMKRWLEYSQIRVDASVTGGSWAKKGFKDILCSVDVLADTQRQKLSYLPFIYGNQRSIWTPDRVTIEKFDGEPVLELDNPRQAFQGHDAGTQWEPAHLSYFSGYAMWNYLAAPFLFKWEGVSTEELEPVDTEQGRLRRLEVHFPPTIATHCPRQLFYVNDLGLLVKMEYASEVTNSGPVTHMMMDHRTFDGIVVPTHRKAYARNVDGTPVYEKLMVEIKIRSAELIK
ncbi:hypothetical protein [Paraburkholderia caribensis]|uniref:hypothetical protein n=1 Tax=Paraburkholderia TaxID=1822464 RepID=UPI001CAC1415|nr:hypothetical protein [Paraburkholderia caribensis]BEU25596.1 hypothetical protein PBP221_57360 [Paraburkholderia sp. 22B1P]CAG9262562.1 conserved hypothetical protein [Paraburkholderia caribensis]